MIADLKPYPALKDFDDLRIGEVPEHWEIEPLCAIAKLKSVKNQHDRELLSVYLNLGVVPFATVKEKRTNATSEDLSGYQAVDPGDFVLNNQQAWRGSVGVSMHKGIVSPAYLVLSLGSRIHPRYANLLLRERSMVAQYLIASKGVGSIQRNLYWPHLKRIPIILPPLSEQSSIVRFLDHIDRKIRRYIRAKQKLINLLEEQKQAIIHRAVTCGLDPNVRLKPSGVEWLGDVPENWRIVALKHVLKRLVDCEHKTAPAVEQSSYRVIRTTAVRYGQLRWSGTYCTTAEGFKAWTQRAVPEPGDVIFTREAPAGEACLVPDGAQVCLGQRTVLMKLRRDEYDSRFLVHMIYAGPPRLRIQLASQGSTVGHFNMDDIGWMKILVPPLAEQQSIVSIINQDTNSLTKAVERAEHEINLLREYRTRLIADVVTGKLDVREAAAQLHDEDQELPPIDESDEISESEEDEPDDLDVAPLEDPET
jgi:type I restriction enzyme, S subunit